jgi:hypothetical protein
MNMGDKLTERERRFLGVALGIISTLFGIYNGYQLSQMQGQVTTDHNAIADLFHELEDHKHILAEHSLQLQHLETVAKITWLELTNFEVYEGAVDMAALLVEGCRAQVDEAASVMDVLMARRLSVKLLKPGAMLDLLNDVRKEAHAVNYELLPRSVSDAYQCDASFVITPFGVAAFLHLPLAMEGDVLTIFEYLPVPFPLGHGLQMTIHPEHPVIAVDDNHTFFLTMSRDTLTACSRMGTYFLCRDSNVKAKAAALAAAYTGGSDDNLCGWFLFTQNKNKTKQACVTTVHPAQNTFFQVSPNDFIFVNKHEHQGFLKCTGKDVQRFSATEILRKNVPPGCTAETDTAIATGTLDVALNATPHTYAWEEAPQFLLSELDIPETARVLDLLDPAKTRVPRDTRDIHDFFEAKKRWLNHDQVSYSNVGLWVAMAAVVIAVILLACCCWKWRSAKRAKKAHKGLHAAARAVTVYNPAFAAEQVLYPQQGAYNNQFRQGLA